MKKIISIIGLGYVGLPLALEFSKKYPTVGFDINKTRVSELMKSYDRTLEITTDQLSAVITSNFEAIQKNDKGLFCTTNLKDLESSKVFIVTVPTPVDNFNNPVLSPLIDATKSIGSVLKRDDYVIFESTVYPGVTEEKCVPVLEEVSGLKLNRDFFVGYSPERINPGDKERTLTKIRKVTSGSTTEASYVIDDLYKEIIEAGTYLAPSIKVAEAAKVIENSQRDINIAFINELAKIFSLLNIDTQEVLAAAGTKWNFLPFKPGLVGGHCIGVDPYYLAQKAQELGYHPEILLSGRRLNDSMGKYIGEEVIKLMSKRSINLPFAEVLILGITFKENCPDIRNTKVIDIYRELISYNTKVDIFDPLANIQEVIDEYGIHIIKTLEKKYQAIVLAVAHSEFIKLDLQKYLSKNGVIYDVKGVLEQENITSRL